MREFRGKITYRDAVLGARRYLADHARSTEAGAPGAVETPFLDALVLLAHAVGATKEQVLARYPEPLAPEAPKVKEDFARLLERRIAGEPVSYLVGHKAFFDIELLVDHRVLVPRPETEILVEFGLRALEETALCDRRPRVLDLCTGSGAVACALATHRPDVFVVATDLSRDALSVAMENATRVGVSERIEFAEGDLYAPVEGLFDLILANPPYLSASEYGVLEQASWPEPKMALEAGERGLEIIERLVKGAVDHLQKKGYLGVECGTGQATEVANMLESVGFGKVDTLRDLANRDRVVIGRYE